jgi:hypothetical protein
MDTLAVCAIFKNEARYVLEWIAFHKAVGFDRFFLYDHDSTDGGADLIRRSGFAPDVTLHHWTQRPGQLQAYDHFTGNHAGEADWVAFIDLDEFVHPLDHPTIRPSIARYDGFGAVLFSWLVFGPSRHRVRPAGLVIDNYRDRFPDDWSINRHVKSMVRTSALRGSGATPHSFTVDGPTCDALGREIYPEPLLPKPIHEGVIVNHYYSKSFEDWNAKLRRGKADTPDDADKGYEPALFFDIERDAGVRDDRMDRFLPRVDSMLRRAI